MAEAGGGGAPARNLEESDAEALARCFERCYGSSYGHPEFYEPEAIRARVRDGSLRSVVVPAGDEIVGHTGLSLVDPGAAIIEAGNTVVDPAHRGTGALKALAIALVDRCRADGLAGFMHYPTTAHEVMQKTAVRFGGLETGIMLAYVPADTEYLEVDVRRPRGRLAATVVLQPLAPLTPRPVVYPDRHRELLRRLYDEMGAGRPPLQAGDPVGASTLTVDENPRQDVLRIGVTDPGADLTARLREIAPPGAAASTLVDLPLESPAADAAVEALAGLGFFYCALLPEFGPGDTLRLQRIDGEPETAFAPELANPAATDLLGYINADRGRVATGPGR